MSARVSIPQYSEVDPKFLALMERVQKDVSATQAVGADDVYDPELVMFLRNPTKDADGFVHYLYVHTDGSADYTAYDANVLPCGVRWMVHHKDWQAMGMALPGTAEPEGYLAEKAKWRSVITAGYLSADEAAEKKNQIEQIMGGH